MYHSFYSSDAPLIVLAVINLAIGLASLFAVIEDHAQTKLPALCWNTFVVFAGVLLPAVWPRFLVEGFVSWVVAAHPHLPVARYFPVRAHGRCLVLAAICASRSHQQQDAPLNSDPLTYQTEAWPRAKGQHESHDIS